MVGGKWYKLAYRNTILCEMHPCESSAWYNGCDTAVLPLNCNKRWSTSRGRPRPVFVIESAAHLVPFVKEAFLHFTDRSVLSRLILFLSFLSILISSLPQSSSLVLADLRPAAADGSLSVTPAVWLQSRRLGRPCCCVGVDGSLVVGSGGYKALGYFRVSLFFSLLFFF